MKMHLAAVVPNEGARRLAWFIGTTLCGDVAEMACRMRCSETTVHRLLSGELVPGGELAFRITLAASGLIDRREWRRRAKGWWFDRPGGAAIVTRISRRIMSRDDARAVLA